MNVKHIVGAPGCGKTHRLLGYVGSLIGNRVAAGDIAFVSFTRAAVKEARDRVGEQFGLSRDDLPYFGTLHSMAYRSVGISRDQVMTQKQWGEFCRGVGLAYTSADGIADDDFLEPLGDEEGDVLKRFHDWRRNCAMSVEEALQKFDPGAFEGWSRGRAEWFTRAFEDFKKDARLYDYTDFLLELEQSGWVPPVRVLILDEAQDLSPLQRRIVAAWGQQIGNWLLAYDEDQAIFSFQGADPAWLLALEGEREFLTESRRVPQGPARVAQGIISRNRKRYRKEWTPKAERGDVWWDSELEDAVNLCAREGGSWYFLARNRHHLAAYSDALMDAGIPFVNLRGHTPRAGMAVVVALRLAMGETVTLEDLKHFANDTSQRDWWVRGAKAEIARQAMEKPDRPVALSDVAFWGGVPGLCERLASARTCLDPLKTAAEKRAFYWRVYSRYGMNGLTRKAEAVISTMHGVKGGGARNVVMSSMMTRRTWEAFDEDPEPERRVWYVGASRTEHRLIVLQPSGKRFFDDW